MKSSISLFCFVGVALLNWAGAQQECGCNAHYSQYASGCPKNCANRNNSASCQVLGPGCECDTGFIFLDKQNGDCVEPYECPAQRCGANAHYSDAASVCPKNCANGGNGAQCQALGPGCECDRGYIFRDDQNGDCVRPNMCPAPRSNQFKTSKAVRRCGDNAHYSDYASVCPKNCSNRYSQVQCAGLAPGCECDDGYIFRGDQNGDCVEAYMCPDTEPPCGCGQNSHYNEYASLCPATCYNRGLAYACQAVGPGCECDSGYVFLDDDSADCVKPQSCPPPPVQQGC